MVVSESFFTYISISKQLYCLDSRVDWKNSISGRKCNIKNSE